MRLVVDNVSAIPVGNLQDVAGMARRFAERIEAGEFGDVTRVTLLIENGEMQQRESWGDMPTGYELMGMLDAAKMAVFADMYDDD